ncbi:ras-related and estrogen-regulated growth inhibitor like protein [Danaus plexippus plexippus]|uniref:small monomeric GTPase n=1 Tax=Danaus plexippus plexippus TaxID=278856 RepID=A0A212FGB9_DANPL|nr:ras-related and estrogen-regulated growth inhibitor like protein [Danaus plexippus plexippus]
MKMTVNRIRVVVLGSPRSGKSAVVVRYLTKRYIGEYSSTGDFLYQHRVAFDGAVSEVEILDTSNCAVSYFIYRCLTTDRSKNFISDLFLCSCYVTGKQKGLRTCQVRIFSLKTDTCLKYHTGSA